MADWLADQVFYEVFPDRFAVGAGGPRRALLPPDAELRPWSALPAQPPRGREAEQQRGGQKAEEKEQGTEDHQADS